MALTGRFGDSTGRPYIEGRLTIPRLGIRGDLSFLFDTGADATYLMPLDALRMGLDYADLDSGTLTSALGVGGMVQDYVEPAVVSFADGKNLYSYDIKLTIAAGGPNVADVPSLLGRDVIDNWRVTYHPHRAKLVANVEKASIVDPLRGRAVTIAPDAARD